MKERCIKKQIFLEGLPRKGKLIDWKNSVGEIIYFIYDNIEGYIKIIDYRKNKKWYLIIEYCDKEFKILTDSLKNCNLGKVLGKVTSEFKIEMGQIFNDDKRDIIIVDREYRKDKNGREWKYYKYHCNKCNWDEGWIEEGHLLNGTGCACCCTSPRIVVVGINDIPTTAPWLIPYFQRGYDEAKLYNKCSNEKIYPICPDCGRIKDKPVQIISIYKTGSIGCYCSDGISYPNKFTFELIEQLQIDFINEYSPEWIGKRAYDFYFELNDKKYILEMDGAIGHGNGKHSKSKITAKESQDIDDYKDRLAKENGIEVIRIDCNYGNNDRFEYIKNNILKDETLKNLFDLSKINWLECNEFACTNLIKIACEYKRNNPNMTTGDIRKIINCTYGTIHRWLKQGNKLGWCNYDPKEENIKSAIKNNKLKRKPVEVFKNGISLGVFESAHELDRKSLELFGVKLSFSNISSVCRGKRNQHKGYTFQYIET